MKNKKATQKFGLLFRVMKSVMKNKYEKFYTTPCANIASATFTKPAMFAPFT